MKYTYSHARPSITVDCVVFGLDDDDLKVLLIERRVEPFQGQWALPGGFMRPEESLDDAARRELVEETGAKDVFLEQLYTFGSPGRDPRGRVVTVAYYALVKMAGQVIQAATDARHAAWFSLDDLPTLAFDHDQILQMAHQRLVGKVRYQPIGFELLPEKFTLTQLQRLYEIVLDRGLDKRNFRKKILSMDILRETREIQQDVAHRAARLYRFDHARYQKLTRDGFHFEI
jgi:8-oxo-dGTP diphosphatase